MPEDCHCSRAVLQALFREVDFAAFFAYHLGSRAKGEKATVVHETANSRPFSILVAIHELEHVRQTAWKAMTG